MKILIYDDNPDYGGHQIMACRGAQALCSDPSLEIIFMLNSENLKLAKNLSDIKNIKTTPSPCSTERFQGLRNRLNRTGILKLSKALQSLSPELILIIQGEIEDSSQCVLAARNANIPCVSYIAIPHTMKKMGAKWGALRDRINQYLFNKPDRYITISESMKALLIERGVTKPIAVVPNGIFLPPPRSTTNQNSPRLLGSLGRIEFKQKQQDFLVETFSSNPDPFKECNLLIAGNGPDEEHLKKIISTHQNIKFMPWQENTEDFYERIDCLIIPSRFEGVPLVMLEALARGIPVIGSSCDGMKDILPESWTFEPENSKSMINAFLQINKSGGNEIIHLQSKIRSTNSVETFFKNFHNAVLPSPQRYP